MKLLADVPAAVIEFYTSDRAKAAAGQTSAEIAAWKRFVTDPRMLDFYRDGTHDPRGILSVLDTGPVDSVVHRVETGMAVNKKDTEANSIPCPPHHAEPRPSVAAMPNELRQTAAGRLGAARSSNT